jgi:CheY-like chemotaxis protein
MPKTIVLVVEDEPLLRMDVVDLIEDGGFTVIEAAHAAAAITILEERDDIRIVFTDIEMPGAMNGIKLAYAIRDRWPPVAIIVTSGHVMPREGDLPVNVPFLSKPFNPTQLHEVLKKAA